MFSILVFSTSLWVKIVIIASIVVVFILVTILNIKVKKPADCDNKTDCDSCPIKGCNIRIDGDNAKDDK